MPKRNNQSTTNATKHNSFDWLNKMNHGGIRKTTTCLRDKKVHKPQWKRIIHLNKQTTKKEGTNELIKKTTRCPKGENAMKHSHTQRWENKKVPMEK